MDYRDIVIKTQELCKKYNPTVLAPFPYERIFREKSDLELHSLVLDEEISGSINLDDKTSKYKILINNLKPTTRQYFTISHELGHYFFHQKILLKEKVLIDGDKFLDKPMLFRSNTLVMAAVEFEANQFAANLLMPEDSIKQAWESLGNVYELANIFKVSVSTISIRLERLGLIFV